MTRLYIDGHDKPAAAILLAHGSGQPATSAFLTDLAAALGDRGFTAMRFNFAYMEKALEAGKPRPPARANALMADFHDAVAAARREIGAELPLYIGGKSLGGRIASMIADQAAVAGLVCLGYPFHPPGKPQTLRTAHLETLATPALICQGERDPFGSRAEVIGYPLAPTIQVRWLTDGDHGFKPRKKSGATLESNLAAAVDAIAAFARSSC